MNSTLKGAWIIDIGKKLNSIQNPMIFDGLLDSSKVGILLQVISANYYENSLSFAEVKVKAKLAGISGTRELKTILDELKKLNLVDFNTNYSEIVVLGLTNEGILKHTTTYFEEFSSDNDSEILINVSESVTQMPEKIESKTEEFSDIFKLKKSDVEKYLNTAVEYNLLDKDEGQGYLYNGNIFRVDDIQKNQKILDSLSSLEREDFLKLTTELNEKQCLDYNYCKRNYNDVLLKKLIKVSLIDTNEVNSPYGVAIFITLPSSFKRFTNSSLIDDVMDFAKAFLSSIYYGMLKSKQSRGRLDTYHYVLRKLINGEEIGCATAICEDYRYLEHNGVLKVWKCSSYGCKMKLQKKQVGEIVYKLLEDGMILETFEKTSTDTLDTKITSYKSPEISKKQFVSNTTLVTDILEIVRTR